jgi:MinD superfamily P-loop ATPase
MAIRIDAERCTGCGSCIDSCAVKALSLMEGLVRVNEEKCAQCGACVQACPNEALELVMDASPEIVHLQARPVARPSSDVPATRTSGQWLSVLGRVAGAALMFLLDRAAGSNDVPKSGRPGTGGCSRRMRRRGGRR